MGRLRDAVVPAIGLFYLSLIFGAPYLGPWLLAAIGRLLDWGGL